MIDPVVRLDPRQIELLYSLVKREAIIRNAIARTDQEARFDTRHGELEALAEKLDTLLRMGS